MLLCRSRSIKTIVVQYKDIFFVSFLLFFFDGNRWAILWDISVADSRLKERQGSAKD